MATLGEQSVGSIVKLNMASIAKNFIVVHQGRPSDIYDNSCEGTWLLLEDLYEARPLDKYTGGFSVVYNDYENSTLHSILNSDYLGLFDEDIQSQIKTVKIPYRPGHGIDTTINTASDGLLTQVFIPSAIEVGISSTDTAASPDDGATLDYFTSGTSTVANNKRIAYLDGTATIWWTRSPYCIEIEYLTNRNNCVITATGGVDAGVVSVTSTGVRPMIILPTTLTVSDDGTISVPADSELTVEVSPYHSVTIGGYSTWFDWHLIPSSRPLVTPPEERTNFVDISWRNGYIDDSQTLAGIPLFDNRQGSWEFYVMHDYWDSWAVAYQTIANAINGKRLKAILDDDIEHYYEGRFWVSDWNSARDGYSRITISYDVYPYKRDLTSTDEDWLWDPFNFETGVIREWGNLTVDGELTITAAGSPEYVSPTFTVTLSSGYTSMSMTLTNPDGTTESYTLADGENSFTDLYLEDGEGSITFIGYGTVSISYRGGYF